MVNQIFRRRSGVWNTLASALNKRPPVKWCLGMAAVRLPDRTSSHTNALSTDYENHDRSTTSRSLRGRLPADARRPPSRSTGAVTDQLSAELGAGQFWEDAGPWPRVSAEPPAAVIFFSAEAEKA